jgi:serine O-acetyltransferase
MIFNKIKKDLYRVSGNTTNENLIKFLYKSPGFKFLFFFRLSQKFSRKSLIGFFTYKLYKYYSIKYGFQIPLSVSIGEGLLFPHFGGIVINSKAKIGVNCQILHNVTIGNNKVGKNIGTPIIGDNVYLGPGCMIIGGIKIANGVLIAPNAYVNIDIPKGALVIGNPGKVIPRERASHHYIYNSLIYQDNKQNS